MSVVVRPKSGPINRPMFLAALASSAAWSWWPKESSDFFGTAFSGGCLIVAMAMGTRAARNLLKDYKLRRDLKLANQISDIHGTARFAAWDEIERAGLADPSSSGFVGLAPMAEGAEPAGPIFPAAPFRMFEASPGAGKTINFVLGSVIHFAQLGRSLFISDVKAELAPMLVEALRRCGFEVWCINPANAHDTICASNEINLYQTVIDAVQADDDFRRDAIKLTIDIAEIHLPESKGGDNKNLFFRNGSRRCLIVLILSQAVLEPDRCTPADVFATLNDPSRFRERLLFLQYEIDKIFPYDGIAAFLKTEAASLLARERDNAEHFGSFVEGATQTLLSFSQGGRLSGYGRGARIRISELRDRQVICFVIAPLTHTREFMPVVSLLNMALLEAVKRKPAGRPVHIVGEEFLNYRFNDIVADMETLRGLKVSADIIIQGFDGLENKFGPKAAAAIEAYCDVRVYAGLNSYNRARRVSEMLAHATVRKVNPSHGQDAKEIQLSSTETGRALMTPDEILAMPRNEALLFVRGLRPIKIRMAHYGEVEPWRDMVGENPLVQGRLLGKPKFRIVYPEDGGPNDIRIEGISYPRRKAKLREKRGVVWVRPRNLAWVMPLASIWLALANLGTPHLRFAYVAAGHAVTASQFQRCDYVGLSSRRIFPADGKCPLIAFFSSDNEGGLR